MLSLAFGQQFKSYFGRNPISSKAYLQEQDKISWK
jgi:hypothetical protein